jgi:hypothetical protein
MWSIDTARPRTLHIITYFLTPRDDAPGKIPRLYVRYIQSKKEENKSREQKEKKKSKGEKTNRNQKSRNDRKGEIRRAPDENPSREGGRIG